MEKLWEKIVEWGESYGPEIITALAILIIGRIAVGIVTKVIRKLMVRSEVDETLSKFVISIVKMALMVVVVIMALGALGVDTLSFTAILGAAGLAIGFALQSSLSNFASGVMIILFSPFKAGDFVEAGGSTGVVEEVHVFNTVMKSPDNKKVIIPNGQIIGGNIVNYSAKETRRVDMVFGIGYDDDIKRAKQLFEKILSEDDRVLKDPAPVIAVSELADSSVNFVVRPWVNTADYWTVYFDTQEKVKLTLDNEGISIPYPQQDVHMHQVAVN